ncbi:MAG: hypothetical protein Q8N55_03725 [bacterium]|nr:hypothetical protein [bacterium]
MPKFVEKPSGVVEEILNEAGYQVEVDIQGMRGRPGDVYEARIEQKIETENFAVVVYEDGSIDTKHSLLLINKKDRVVACVMWHKVATPAMFLGKVTILKVTENDGNVAIKYKIGKGYHDKSDRVIEETFALKSKKEVEVSERIITDLIKVS